MKPKFGDYIRQLRIETGKREFDEKRIESLAEVFGLNRKELKEELLSEKITQKLYQFDTSEKVLILADQKIKYLRQEKSKQEKLNL